MMRSYQYISTVMVEFQGKYWYLLLDGCEAFVSDLSRRLLVLLETPRASTRLLSSPDAKGVICEGISNMI